MFERAKDATGDAEIGIGATVLKFVRYLSVIIYPSSFIIAIEERETAIAKRLHHTADHAFKRAARNDIFLLLVLHRLRGFTRIERNITRIGDKDGRFRVDINMHKAGVKLFSIFSGQAVMPGGFVALWRFVPVDASEVIRIHLFFFLLLRFQVLKTKQLHAPRCFIGIFTDSQPYPTWRIR